MNIPSFSVNRPVTVLMVILVVSLFGVISFFRLGLDLLPDIEYPVCSIVTTYEGVSSEDIENVITRPVEEMVSTVKHVKKVYSISQEGISAVVVEFEWGTLLDFAVQDIREKLSWITDLLPKEADAPSVIKYNMSDYPVIFYGVTGMEDTRLLREYLKDNLRARLERLEGVASVLILGGLEREINCYINRDKLKATHTSIDQVIEALRRENLNVSGGHLKKGFHEYLVRTMGEYKDIDTIRNTIINMNNGVPIYIRDVAEVEDTHKEIRNHTRTNRRDSVLMAIMKQSGSNTVKVIERVKKTLEEVRPQLPPGLKFYPVFDTGGQIRKVVNRSASNAITGGILAIILIFFFLRSIKPTITIALAIPLSIITTFIGIYAMNYTFNIMTLGGMALGVGMLVDNAIVVIENIYRHLREEGRDSREASIVGASEVGMAITASTLTTMAVFLPMTLSGGISGRLSRPLALTVCLSLAASLFVAITIVPMIASAIFRKGSGKGSSYKEFESFRDLYGKTLKWALLRRKWIMGFAGILFILTLYIIFKVLGFDFMPRQDTPMLMAVVRMPVGTSLEETDRAVKNLENISHQEPETLYSASFVGLSKLTKQDVALGFGAGGVNEAQFMLKLKDKSERSRSSEEIIESIRNRTPRIKGGVINFMDVGQMLMGTIDETPVIIKVFGKDMEKLKEISQVIISRIRDVPGLRDIDQSFKEGKPEFQIRIDREKASQLGLSVGQIASTVKAALLGIVASKYRIEGDEFDIRVRFREEDRDSLEDIRNIPIASPMGLHIPLYQVADIRYEKGPVKIFREDQERKIMVSANTHKRDISGIVKDIKKRLSGIRLPSGYFIEYGGTYEKMKESRKDLIWALAIAVLLVYMVMAAQFESLLQPFIIMFTVPLSVIGVVAGLFIFGLSMSIPALMGMIIMAGIAVNNGILMVDYINRLVRQGVERVDAIIRGPQVRLRPILITALTTILGTLPMALSRSEGAELRSPMGIAISFGLGVATFLTLYMIPIIYSIAMGIRKKAFLESFMVKKEGLT